MRRPPTRTWRPTLGWNFRPDERPRRSFAPGGMPAGPRHGPPRLVLLPGRRDARRRDPRDREPRDLLGNVHHHAVCPLLLDPKARLARRAPRRRLRRAVLPVVLRRAHRLPLLYRAGDALH